MRASVITLGCKVNEYESQAIMNELKQAGYEITEGLEYADLYVVNTCAVTNTAERKSRQMLSKIHKLNKDAKIVVVGCAVQNNVTNFNRDQSIIALTGNNRKHEIMRLIAEQNKILPDLEHNKFTNMLPPIETRTRQFIKIQDGCNYFCTYCLIPYLRGRSRSRDMSDILAEIRATSANEVVLTGINMSDYRIDGELALPRLVAEIDKLNKRFRLSSIECNVLTDEMLDVLKNAKNFCPHFHLSLQSASNTTLKRMNRRYTIEEFIDKVQKVKKTFPLASISTDLIVGFKGETDSEFNETMTNLEKIKFSFIHIFPYSERTGTVASKLDIPMVDKSVVKSREHILIEYNKQCKHEFYNKNLGTSHTVLIEECIDGFSVGYTDNYIYTFINARLNIGEIVNVCLTGEYKNGMIGKIDK